MSDFVSSFRKRLIQLRNEKNLSAREMSLSLGHNEGYIDKIELGYSLPSMKEFPNICDCLEVTPYKFFEYYVDDSYTMQKILMNLSNMTPEQLKNISAIIDDIIKK